MSSLWFQFLAFLCTRRGPFSKVGNESCEGTNTEDPGVDFERVANRPEVEEDEDAGFPLELERMVAQKDREMKPHQEETKIVNLGVVEERKEVKIGTGMTTLV